MNTRTARRIATAALAPMLAATTLVAAPTLAADTAVSTGNYSQASDGFPSGAPAEAIWQPTIRAEDLPAFVSTYGAANIEIVKIDGILQLGSDWRSIGVQVKSARDVGSKTEVMVVGTSRSIGLRVADDVVLSINVHPTQPTVTRR